MHSVIIIKSSINPIMNYFSINFYFYCLQIQINAHFKFIWPSLSAQSSTSTLVNTPMDLVKPTIHSPLWSGITPPALAWPRLAKEWPLVLSLNQPSSSLVHLALTTCFFLFVLDRAARRKYSEVWQLASLRRSRFTGDFLKITLILWSQMLQIAKDRKVSNE